MDPATTWPTLYSAWLKQFTRKLIVPPTYSDGIHQSIIHNSIYNRKRNVCVSVVNNNALPSARLVSTTVVANKSQSDHEVSLLKTLWSQFIEHDLFLPLKPTSTYQINI